ITVRIPLSRIGNEVRQKHSVVLPGASISLADGYLIFHFEEAASTQKASTSPVPATRLLQNTIQAKMPASQADATRVRGPTRKRRPSTRNRMRIRGLGIIVKTVNAMGHTDT